MSKPSLPVRRRCPSPRRAPARVAAALAFAAALAAPSAARALTIVPTMDLQTLTSGLGSQGITIVDVTLSPGAEFTGAAPTGTYDDGPLGLPDGILLTSGAAINALPPNDATNSGASFPGDYPDPLCESLAGIQVHDAVRMTVHFTLPTGADGIAFDWMFGSEEYPEYVGNINDSAGVFIRSDAGAGFGPFQNILLDLQGNPVTINGPFFSGNTVIVPTVDNPITEYDGSTPHITTNHPLSGGPGVLHEMVIVVCDASDDILDSGLFIGGLRACSGTCESVAYCGDGVVNGAEDCDDGNNVDSDACTNTCQGPDADGDGVSDIKELYVGTDPATADTDADGVDDATEIGFDPLNPLDANGDGVLDALDPCYPNLQFCDPDFDGLPGTLEIALGTDPLSADTDGDGIDDAAEVGDPTSPLDTDGDGLIDAVESNTEDADGDGLPAHLDATEGDACSPDVTSAGCDQDGDGLPNGKELAAGTDPLNADTDGDLAPDGLEHGPGPLPKDTDGDGLVDALEPGTVDTDGDGASDQNDPANTNPCIPNPNALPCDKDGDGLTNAQELALGTNPNDADTDDDGVPDGAEPAAAQDTDGDGLINALDPDSDGDLLKDGTEMGLGCGGPGTDLAAGNCVPDADGGATKTDPLNPDTDGGGLPDGIEDANHDGVVGPNETDPSNQQADDAAAPDADGDGLPDAFEALFGSDPTDTDSDDDGVPDGLEIDPLGDPDGDGLPNFVDSDSDNDGLFDGTEQGYPCLAAGTDLAAGQCIPDADGGATTTSPVHADTDGGGVKDGAEDWNHDGAKDPGETDPTFGHAADDGTLADTDFDGLPDAQELAFGSDPNDSDSDDDGVKDGDEPNATMDLDGDGLVNANDPDSDGDGLFDGTELGLGCAFPGLLHCVPDGDGGATKTSPLNPDTDGGGVLDGVEDKNKNGVVDPGETDPNDPTDDVCANNTDCAGAQGGLVVCDPTTSKCTPAKCDASATCPPPDACHFVGVCDPASGACTYADKPDGASCDDGNPCTVESCKSGACTAQSAQDFTPCEGGVCIAGHCFLDSVIEGTGGGTTGPSTGGGAGEGGGPGEGGTDPGEGGTDPGEGGSGTGAGSLGPGADAGKYTLLGGACSLPAGNTPSRGALLLVALAALALARRRPTDSASP